MSRRAIAGQLRERLGDTLLIQADAKTWQQAVACADRPGGGLVLTGQNEALDMADHLVHHENYSRPIIVDRAQYTGARRKLAKDPFDPNWIRRQRDSPVAAVLTDSGYVGANDIDGLRAILTSTSNWNNRIDEDVVAVLPLHRGWLNADAGLPILISEVIGANVPIAVAFEHANDPLGTKWAVDGLVQLLAAPVEIVVLRCDIAALGALAYGAIAAAVGARSALRHLYPSDGSGGGRQPQPAAVVKACLAYYSLDKIKRLVAIDPDDPWWQCDCDECGGRRLDRISASADPAGHAFLHSLHTLYHIRDDIIGRAATPAERQQSWASQCSHARAVHLTIRRTVPDWRTPPALKHWDELVTFPIRQSDRGSESPDRSTPPPLD